MILLSVLWIGAVTYAALTSWPTLPLDLPARDPQVQAALARAMRAHVVRHALTALVPAVLVCGLAVWRKWRQKR